jgi:hypothetical protein
MKQNSNKDYKNQAATTAKVTTTVARATVTGSKRATATMAMTATTATMVTTATMATMVTMIPNSNDATSGDEDNKDTKRRRQQQRQWRTMAVIDLAEAQDAVNAPMAAPRWRLHHHTVVSHRIDPTGEYIENLDPKSGSQNNLDRLAGQPIKIYYKMTKKRPCTQSGFAKKITLEQKSC